MYGGSETKTDLSRRSQAKAEALVSVLGKFGISDQLAISNSRIKQLRKLPRGLRCSPREATPFTRHGLWEFGAHPKLNNENVVANPE